MAMPKKIQWIGRHCHQTKRGHRILRMQVVLGNFTRYVERCGSVDFEPGRDRQPEL